MSCRLADRQQVLAMLPSEPMLADVVASTGMEYRRAQQTLSDFVRHGKARIVRTTRVAHSRRPVAVYAPAEALDDLATDDGQPWSSLQSVWR